MTQKVTYTPSSSFFLFLELFFLFDIPATYRDMEVALNKIGKQFFFWRCSKHEYTVAPHLFFETKKTVSTEYTVNKKYIFFSFLNFHLIFFLGQSSALLVGQCQRNGQKMVPSYTPWKDRTICLVMSKHLLWVPVSVFRYVPNRRDFVVFEGDERGLRETVDLAMVLFFFFFLNKLSPSIIVVVGKQIKNGRLALGTWQGIYLNGKNFFVVIGTRMVVHHIP